MKRILITSLNLLLILCGNLFAAKYVGNPDNYIQLRDQLAAGDSLELVPGEYLKGLRIAGMHGEPNRQIVIYSAKKHEAVLIARTSSNTADIINSSHVTIDGLKFDGMSYANIDAVKAGGSALNYAHNIHIVNNLIVGHGANQQTVAISTKIPCWDWTISHNMIVEPGTGLYLGNSDGGMPFVRGIVEFNSVVNSLGYCMQIKHQNNRSEIEDMPLETASTIIRHNVFAKDDRTSPDGDRPNILVGGQAPNGDGTDDRVEIYGNLFYGNPREYLLQGTGNISVHNNIFIDSDQGAMNFQTHNSRRPKNLNIYNNTVFSCGKGIHFYGVDLSAEQIVVGNAIFTQGKAIPDEFESMNLIGVVSDAENYFVSPSTDLVESDFYPVSECNDIICNIEKFDKDFDYNKDYNGMPQSGNYYGAYSGFGENQGNSLSFYIKELTYITSVSNCINTFKELSVRPNPCGISFTVDVPKSVLVDNTLHLTDLSGREVISNLEIKSSPDTGTIEINVSSLESAVYILSFGDYSAKVIVKK